MGATQAVDVRTTTLQHVMRDLGMTEGFDVGMEMSGHGEALRDMLNSMNHGGRVAILGIPPKEVSVDFNQIIFKGLEVKGIYGREMFETWYKMVAMLQSGLDIRAVLTHHFKAEEFQQAFEVMRSGQSGKVVLDWTP
jgi:threonine 3-dehydrogenase